MPRLRSLVLAQVALAAVLGPGVALAQEVQLHAPGGNIYADLPFELQVVAKGFEEAPPPEVSSFSIRGAQIDYIGMTPDVSRQVMIINGQRSESRTVTHVFRYRVRVEKAGSYEIPAVRVTQGTTAAGTTPARFTADEVSSTPEMRLELSLPERPVWIGETFELSIDWYVARDPDDPTFVIPLFENEDQFRVQEPEAVGQRAFGFTVGDRQLRLPYEVEQTEIDGRTFNHFRFRAQVTPQRSGTLDLPPAAVLARLQVGYGRDSFGFRTARRELFKAVARPRTLEVRPVPSAGKPTSFAGAVGESFSITAQASRTVVRVGDPIDLTLTIRGDAVLEGLSLPPLSELLSSEHFEVPAELPPGEVADGAKTFRTTLRLRSTEAREIPAIPFSYFDPKRADYVTVSTEPIALSIAGSNVVGAGDVVSGAARPTKAEEGNRGATVIDADLALSAAERTLRTTRSLSQLLPVLAALYVLGLLIFAVRTWQVRTRDARGESSELRQRHKALIAAIEEGRTRPARESAPAILSTLRALATVSKATPPRELVTRLETEGYRPDADREPLAADLLDALAVAARDLRKRAAKTSSNAAAAIVFLGVLGASAPASAQESIASQASTLDQARARYSEALALPDREARARAFQDVARDYAELASRYPDRPELLTDWGNAALGARDFGHAALAFKRALAIDPGLERAELNLAWLRRNGPAGQDTAPRSAADTLFFWHRSLSRSDKHLVAALAFLLAALLAAPFARSDGRRRLLRRIALLPAALCLAMLASALSAGSVADQVVVIDGGAELLSADSIGAPPVTSVPPGAGREARALARRDGWVRLELSDGTRGWMRRDAVRWVQGDES